MTTIFVVQAKWWTSEGKDDHDLVAAFHDEEHAKAHAKECADAGEAFAEAIRKANAAAREATRGGNAQEFRRVRNVAMQDVHMPSMFCSLAYDEYEQLSFEVVPVELRVPL